MPSPASRVLALLELLQDRPSVTGGRVAEVLEVHPRTVRRYVAALQELGVPVEGGRAVRLRFLWHVQAGAGPRWEQAFSWDAGATWTTNWTMDLVRAAA